MFPLPGKSDVNELMAKLMHAVETANITRAQDIQEEVYINIMPI